MSDNPGSKKPSNRGIYDSNASDPSDNNISVNSRPKSVKRVGMYDRPKRPVISPLLLFSIVLIMALVVAGLFLFVIR